MKKFRKEITAIGLGVAFAYAWQLFAILLCYISDSNGDFVTRDMFIPAIGIQLALAPLVAWIMLGLLKVSWFTKWLQLTLQGLTFSIPFVLIATITLFIVPSLWHEKMYWLGTIAVSIAFTFTVPRLLSKS